MALPPRVANAIAARRESLTSRRRSRAAKVRAKADQAAGVVPGFMRSKKHKKMPAKTMAAITAAANSEGTK